MRIAFIAFGVVKGGHAWCYVVGLPMGHDTLRVNREFSRLTLTSLLVEMTDAAAIQRARAGRDRLLAIQTLFVP